MLLHFPGPSVEHAQDLYKTRWWEARASNASFMCRRCFDSGVYRSHDWFSCSCEAGTTLERAYKEDVERERRDFHKAGGACFTCRDTGHFDPINCPDCDKGLSPQAKTKPFVGRTLDTWLIASGGPPALVAALRDWEEAWPAKKPFLLLHGPTGTGKSSLAAALLHSAMRRTRKAGRRYDVTELVAALRPGPDQDETVLQRARETPLLFLDDLGVTKPSEWVDEQLYRIINTRNEGELWTIITTNLSPDDGTLRERLGDRTFWRIHEKSLSVEVNHGNLRDR